MAIQNPKGPHHVEHETGGVDALVTLDGSIILTGTIPDARHSANVPLKNTTNVFTSRLEVNSSFPMLALRGTTQAVDQKLWRLYISGTDVIFEAINDAETIVAATTLALKRAGDVAISRDLYEKGRAAPIGHWTDYAAVLATGGGGSVALNSTTTCRYTQIGKTLILEFYLTVTVTGTPQIVTINLPAGITAASQSAVGAGFSTVFTPNPLYLQTTASGTVVNLFRDFAATAWSAGSHVLTGTAIVSIT